MYFFISRSEWLLCTNNGEIVVVGEGVVMYVMSLEGLHANDDLTVTDLHKTHRNYHQEGHNLCICKDVLNSCSPFHIDTINEC